MTSPAIYTALLALRDPWYISSLDVDVQKQEMHVHIFHQPVALPCPECSRPCPVHDHVESRTWRHLDLWQCKTWLHCQLPRTDCPEHGIHRVKTPWAEPNSRFTMAMEAKIIDAIGACETVTGACRIMRVSWDEARGIMERAVSRGLARKESIPIRNLGVDEKAILKGHRYVTLAYDLDRGVVDEVVKDRKRESLERYFDGKSRAQLTAIEAICMDMWEPFRQAVISKVPKGARKIVHDKYHIIAHMNKALNEVRAKEARELQSHGDDSLKGTRQMLLWGDENRPERYESRFAKLMKSDLATSKVWALKENLRRLWNHRSSRVARKHFSGWNRWALRLDQMAVTKVANMIKERIDQVVSYCDHPVSNGVGEGLNSRIMSVQRRARGYRFYETFRMAILFFCGGLDLKPSCERTH